MAKVIHVDHSVAPLPPPALVVLSLTGEEALFLRNLMGWCVIGSGPLRDHCNNIWTELKDIPGLKNIGKPYNMRGQVELI